MTSMWANVGSAFSRRMMSSTPARLAVRGVDDEHVDPCVAQGLGALPCVAEEAHRRADAEAPLAVLRGVRVLLGLVEVLHGDEAGEVALVVDEGKLLDLVLGEDRERLVGVHADPAR